MQEENCTEALHADDADRNMYMCQVSKSGESMLKRLETFCVYKTVAQQDATLEDTTCCLSCSHRRSVFRAVPVPVEFRVWNVEFKLAVMVLLLEMLPRPWI